LAVQAAAIALASGLWSDATVLRARSLEIAEIPFVLETADVEVAAILDGWAPDWRPSPRAGGFAVHMETGRLAAETGQLEIVDGDEREVIPLGEPMSGCIDLRAQRAWFTLAPLEVHVFSAARLTFAVVALRRGVLWVHAVGFRRADRAFVLVGRSGAGKTTLGRQVERGALLGDDTVAVRPAGPGGAPMAYATPFQSAGAEPPGPGQAGLGGLFLLEKGPLTTIAPVPRLAALARLWSCVFSPERAPPTQARALALIEALLAQAPPAVFSCALEPGVLDIIR
jgi:hypothetical protein